MYIWLADNEYIPAILRHFLPCVKVSFSRVFQDIKIKNNRSPLCSSGFLWNKIEGKECLFNILLVNLIDMKSLLVMSDMII
ncbi:MAG: hypothetical protein CVT92_15250 [Bacteroidetes bacterium HGW-Bacteroidetes-1]|jgi:hypothetical protein|nr:MAG: hypothetical protein CVT92_15250 [Bacteroidetes bacterium HGW-Bacteroidetes-1]